MELCKEYKPMNCNEETERINESFDVDFQLNLPQYLEDIDRLIKCCVKNVVCDWEFTGSQIKIYGKSIISVLYLDSTANPYSNEFEEEFSKSFDLSQGEQADFADVDLTTKYYNHRLINQRRIDVHSSLGVCICVYSKTGDKLLCSCENAFTRQIETNALIQKNAGIVSAEFDELFPIAESDYQIKNIINAFLVSVVEDKKIIKDKMLVKLKNEISVIYIDENNTVEKCIHTFSVSKVAECPSCGEEDTAFISSNVSQLYVKAKNNSSNMLTDIEAVGRLTVDYKICTCEKMSLAVDSYIPHYKTETQSRKLPLKCDPIYYCDDKTVQLNFESEKNIIEVIDLQSDIISSRVEKSVMYVCACVSVLYYDDTSQICFFEKTEEFSFPLSDDEYDGEGTATLKSFDFVIKNTDTIVLRLNFEYSAYLYKIHSLDCLIDIEVSGEIEEADSPQLTLYFADKGENVWDIAKNFSSDMRLIMEENELTSEIISDRRVLLVEGM